MEASRAVGLRAALTAYGRPTREFGSMLDFGCGSGRVIP